MCYAWHEIGVGIGVFKKFLFLAALVKAVRNLNLLITRHQGRQGRFRDGLPTLPVRNIKQMTIVVQPVIVIRLELAVETGIVILSRVPFFIQVPLSRQDLAEMTGTTTETASRVMSQFQKDGFIRTGRQWIAITNAAELKSIATEE